MFYFFRHSSESSLSYWCRHNIHIDRDSVQDSLHPHSGWIEKSRVGLEYMLKRRSTYGPSNDEGRRVDRRRRGEGPKMCCVISKISDARIWHRLTLHHSVCEPSKPSFSTLICLSGSARTERHWVTEPVVGYWALWYSTLFSLAGLMVFSSKLCTSVLLYFFLHSRLLYSPYPPSLPAIIS
jgi:hypothetical protein